LEQSNVFVASRLRERLFPAEVLKFNDQSFQTLVVATPHKVRNILGSFFNLDIHAPDEFAARLIQLIDVQLRTYSVNPITAALPRSLLFPLG